MVGMTVSFSFEMTQAEFCQVPHDKPLHSSESSAMVNMFCQGILNIAVPQLFECKNYKQLQYNHQS